MAKLLLNAEFILNYDLLIKNLINDLYRIIAIFWNWYMNSAYSNGLNKFTVWIEHSSQKEENWKKEERDISQWRNLKELLWSFSMCLKLKKKYEFLNKPIEWTFSRCTFFCPQPYPFVKSIWNSCEAV